MQTAGVRSSFPLATSSSLYPPAGPRQAPGVIILLQRGDKLPGLESVGKLLLVIGGFIVLLGLILVFAPKIPFVGRLPGDIYVEKGNFRFFFPLVTTLIISLILTLVLNIILRLFK